jgi:hypothetical protein
MAKTLMFQPCQGTFLSFVRSADHMRLSPPVAAIASQWHQCKTRDKRHMQPPMRPGWPKSTASPTTSRPSGCRNPMGLDKLRTAQGSAHHAKWTNIVRWGCLGRLRLNFFHRSDGRTDYEAYLGTIATLCAIADLSRFEPWTVGLEPATHDETVMLRVVDNCLRQLGHCQHMGTPFLSQASIYACTSPHL